MDVCKMAVLRLLSRSVSFRHWFSFELRRQDSSLHGLQIRLDHLAYPQQASHAPDFTDGGF